MKYNERVQKWNETMRTTHMDADEGDGHWVTTKEGNHMFINGEGEPTKGNPHVLAAAKGESQSSKPSSTKKKAAPGEVDKRRAERGGVARKMYESGEIPQDTMGMLDSMNYSDEIMDRAVERGWITKKQAESIKSGKKSGSSAKTYSVQDDKAKTTEFNKAMRESGEDAAAEILDTLPAGTVLEGETAYFKKGSDGKWKMSQDGENYDPVHYSHWFAASVCEAGHTDVILPKQAVPEEEEAPKRRSEPKRSSGESKKAIKSVLDRSGFWTRDNEMEDDFKEAGFDVLENNDEYIVVSDNKSDSDTQFQMRKFRGGSSFTLEPPTAISFGGEDDDDWDDEDDEEDW